MAIVACRQRPGLLMVNAGKNQHSRAVKIAEAARQRAAEEGMAAKSKEFELLALAGQTHGRGLGNHEGESTNRRPLRPTSRFGNI